MIRPSGRRRTDRPDAAFDDRGAVMSEMGPGGSLDEDEGAEYAPSDGEDEQTVESRPSGPGTGSPTGTDPGYGSSGTEDSSGGSPGHKGCVHVGCRCEVTFPESATAVFRFICHQQCENAAPVVSLADDHTCGCSHGMCVR
jgi:hypothetical protein